MTQRGHLQHVVSDLWRDGRGWILLAISAGNLLSLGTRVAFPAVLPQIKAEFALTNTTAGLLLSVIWVSFATAQLPGGVLTDRIGERNTVVASMLLAAGSLAVVVAAPTVGVFVVGLVAFGLATGLFGTPRITVLSDVYSERAATALSVHTAVGNIGNALFPVIATAITGWFAWRVGIGIGLPGFLALAVGLWLIVPTRTSPRLQRNEAESLGATARRLGAAVTGRPVVIATGAMICLGFVWQAYTAFLPTYLIEVKGLSQPVAATALGAFFVGGGAIQPLVGNLADRYHEGRIMIVITAGTALALGAMPFVAGPVALLGLALLASLQLAFWPIVFAYIPRALPDASQGSGFGVLRTLFLYCGATGPVVVGFLADRGRFDESFLLLAGVTGVALLLAVVLPRVD